MTDPRKPFSFIEISGKRSVQKPRTNGLTLISDWGLGLSETRELLETTGEYLDIAKIATGTARLYKEDLLMEKLSLYSSFDVRPYLGGQFMEYVYAHKGPAVLERFLEEAYRLGFRASEVSENYVRLDPDERVRQIRMMREVGIDAFAEVGSKKENSDPRELVEQALRDMDAGAEMVLVEGAEIVLSGSVNHRMVDVLSASLDIGRTMFELPTTRIGSTLPEIHHVKKTLIRMVGPDVNIANLSPGEIMETESLRVGLGVVGPDVQS
ncbi:MAG: phosphosulfolactate synthase [Desulfatiglandaceae bacterium]